MDTFEKLFEGTVKDIYYAEKAILKHVFELLGKRASGKKCPAIDGIIEEASEVMKEAEDDMVRDAAMLAAAQSVEHYEISRYGTLVPGPQR